MTNSESPLKPKQVKKIYTISGVNLSFTNSEERYIGRDDLILISLRINQILQVFLQNLLQLLRLLNGVKK